MTPVPSAGARWACLMYHEVPAEGQELAGAAGRFAIGAPGFARQLDWIGEAGWRATTVEAAREAAGGDVVAITFDDGHATHYSGAFPLLAERGMRATFFAVAGWIGRPGYVTVAQAREMAGAGMSIQSHTMTHPFLSELGQAALREELRGARLRLEDLLGLPVEGLGLPNGDPPRRRHRDLIREAGYAWVAGSGWGYNRRGGDGLIRRYTVPPGAGREELLRLVECRSSALSPEGARYGALNRIRRALGPSRYSRVRRLILDYALGHHS